MVDFNLSEPQSRAFQIAQRPITDLNLEWGRGCGKSWFDRFIGWIWVARADGKPRLELLDELGLLDRLDDEQRRHASKVRGVRIVFLMPTLKQFKDVHGGGMEADVTEWSHLNPKPNWTHYSVNFPGGSWMMPFPSEQHSSQRARGIRADVVISDEADDIDPSVFDSVIRPWFSEPWSLKIRVTSGTYKRGRHGLLYQRRVAGQDKTRPRYHSIHATYRDCPELVDADEVADAKRDTPPAVFAREWECDPDSAEGLVYPFREDFHVRPAPPGVVWSEILVGADHGWEDPGVLLTIGVLGSGKDAECWILDEVYKSHKVEDWWVDQCKQIADWYPNHKLYGDPSMPSRVEAYRSKGGARICEVDNSIEDGVSAVANRLFIREPESGEPYAKLYVTPNCKQTIREFGLYRRKRDPKNSDAYLDEIEDRNNHAMDALRYAIFNRFGPSPGTSPRGFRRYDSR